MKFIPEMRYNQVENKGKKMKTYLQDLHKDVQFAFIAMVQTAIYFKDAGMTKEQFVQFAAESWTTMELNDLGKLREAIQSHMQSETKHIMEDYMKRKGNN